MLVKANYLGVILIWSTTPLAIQWSGEDGDFIFAVTSRMVIGMILSLLLVWLLKIPMGWHTQARKSYLAAGIGIYGAMMCVYWAAQFIPSGWIAVVFGLTPIATGLLATRFLDEGALTPLKLVGLLTGVLGLAGVFYQGNQVSPTAWLGVVGILVAVVLHSISTVMIKRVNYHGHGLVMTAGGLIVAVPLYLLTWALAGMTWPEDIGVRAGWSILYLGVIATVAGFAMFFYALRHIDATRMALLTLVTPVLALLLGYLLNGEAFSWSLVIGAAMILSGLAIYEWDDRTAVSISSR